MGVPLRSVETSINQSSYKPSLILFLGLLIFSSHEIAIP